MSTNELALQLNPNVHLVARNPVEMQQAQTGLVEWLTAKIAAVHAEMADNGGRETASGTTLTCAIGDA